MAEETQNLAEVPEVTDTPAPEQAETAAPASSDAEVPEETADAPQKTFTQDELDAIISKRLAKEQRKWEREQKLRAASKPVAEPPAELPPAEQFESPEAYAEALAEQISGTFHRHVVAPGQDYSNEDPRVQAICAATHTPEVVAAY